MLYELNSKIITKKQHPCGSYEWQIIRTGADYKLKCLGCGHIILVDSKQLLKMSKRIIKEGN
jgi:hypothetical protein